MSLVKGHMEFPRQYTEAAKRYRLVDELALPLTRASGLAPFVAFLKAAGAPTGAFLEQARIPPTVLEEGEALVPLHSVHQLAGLATRWLEIGNLGVVVGRQTCAFDLGAFGQVLGRSVTVFDYLQTGSRFVSSVTSGEKFWMTREGDLVRFHHYQPGHDMEGRCQSDLYVLAVTIEMLRRILGPDWSPRQVNLLAAQAQMIGDGAVFGDAEVRMNQQHSSFTLPMSLLGRPIASAARDGRSPSNGVHTLKPVMPTDLVGAIEALVESLLETGDLRVDVVAEAADTSTRTLQRFLRKHGTSYSDVVDGVRIRLASDWLAHSSMPIAEIANGLGYSDPAHFSRAFRRKAGTSPQRYRNNHA